MVGEMDGKISYGGRNSASSRVVGGQKAIDPIPAEETGPLAKAYALVHGPRQAAYDHPANNYRRLAGILNAIWADKLAEPLEAEDAALAMVAVKLAREAYKHSDDNLVDLAGYAEVVQMIHDRAEEQE